MYNMMKAAPRGMKLVRHGEGMILRPEEDVTVYRVYKNYDELMPRDYEDYLSEFASLFEAMDFANDLIAAFESEFDYLYSQIGIAEFDTWTEQYLRGYDRDSVVAFVENRSKS